MTRRGVLLAVAMALTTAWLPNVSVLSAPADPVTGTWAGELTLQDMPRAVAVTMALHLDTHNVVTGTVTGLPNPAEVKVGSFDPKSRELKLQLGKTGDPKVLLVLQGTVDGSKATGQMTGDGSGTFALTRKP